MNQTTQRPVEGSFGNAPEPVGSMFREFQEAQL
jgi:hypothetical protein